MSQYHRILLLSITGYINKFPINSNQSRNKKTTQNIFTFHIAESLQYRYIHKMYGVIGKGGVYISYTIFVFLYSSYIQKNITFSHISKNQFASNIQYTFKLTYFFMAWMAKNKWEKKNIFIFVSYVHNWIFFFSVSFSISLFASIFTWVNEKS